MKNPGPSLSSMPGAQGYPPPGLPSTNPPPASNGLGANLPSAPTEYSGPDTGASNLDDFEQRLANLKKL